MIDTDNMAYSIARENLGTIASKRPGSRYEAAWLIV